MTASESLKSTFPIFLDGQQMAMAEIALREKADRCESAHVAAMYRIEANRYVIARQQFHAEVYPIMAARYRLPLMRIDVTMSDKEEND